jgi:hypothetical protein
MMCCNQNFATAFLSARVLFAVMCGIFSCGLYHTTTSFKKFSAPYDGIAIIYDT